MTNDNIKLQRTPTLSDQTVHYFIINIHDVHVIRTFDAILTQYHSQSTRVDYICVNFMLRFGAIKIGCCKLIFSLVYRCIGIWYYNYVLCTLYSIHKRTSPMLQCNSPSAPEKAPAGQMSHCRDPVLFCADPAGQGRHCSPPTYG